MIVWCESPKYVYYFQPVTLTVQRTWLYPYRDIHFPCRGALYSRKISPRCRLESLMRAIFIFYSSFSGDLWKWWDLHGGAKKLKLEHSSSLVRSRRYPPWDSGRGSRGPSPVFKNWWTIALLSLPYPRLPWSYLRSVYYFLCVLLFMYITFCVYHFFSVFCFFYTCRL